MLGSAYSALTASTTRMTRYFQRGNSSIAGPRAAPPRGTTLNGGTEGSGALQGALGQDVADGGLLHADAHVVCDLDGDEVLADLGDHAGDAAVGQHLVAALQLAQHGLVLLLPLHLRADHQEVHDRDQDDRKQQHAEAAALRRGGRGDDGGRTQGGEEAHRWFLWKAENSRGLCHRGARPPLQRNWDPSGAPPVPAGPTSGTLPPPGAAGPAQPPARAA